MNLNELEKELEEELRKIENEERRKRIGEASAALASKPPTLKGLFNESRYRNNSLLGRGAFGSVRKVRRNGTNYALKRTVFNMYNRTNNIKPFPREYFDKEVKVLRNLQENPYVIHLVNANRSNMNGYILMELLKDGYSLYDAIHKEVLDSMKYTEFTKMLNNLIKGLRSIHDMGYLHLDIKPENIWIYPDTGDIKYMDFGFSCKMIDGSCLLSKLVGTKGYLRNPEPRYNGMYEYNPTNDIYSLYKTFEDIREGVRGERKSIVNEILSQMEDDLKVNGGRRKTRKAKRGTRKRK